MPRYSSTEQVGVHAVASLVLKELGWIFREQLIADMGIDAHIERVDEQGTPTGQLIAVQIKSGASHFNETQDAYVYYGSRAHLDYWTGHALPVILVAHLPEINETLWVRIDESTVEHTAKQWKVAIPKAQRLGASARANLEEAFHGSPRQQRLRRLAIDEPLMRHIESGLKVSVELEDWYNKSLGRTTVQVIVHDGDAAPTVQKEWFQFFLARDMRTLAQMLFPWADAHVDRDFYDEHDELEQSEEARVLRALHEDYGFARKTRNLQDLYPYADSCGEVASYRLQLSLNGLGKAYLTVSDHLDEE